MRSKFPTGLLLKGFFQTPDIILPLIKGRYRKHKGVEKDYLRANGTVTLPPLQISMRITNVCNHRCAVCGQYGSHGYMYGEKSKDLLKTIPAEKYKKMVGQLAKHKPIYYVTGGEPFLYPDFIPLMNYIKKKGSIVTVVTNGVKLAECAEEIVKNSWDMILVSFDGPEDIHDACRGVKGAYRTAVDGLRKLHKLRRQYRQRKPYIFTSLTLSPANIDYLDETFKLNEDIGPDLVVVYLSWFTSESIGSEQSKILKGAFGIDAYTWRSYAKAFTEDEADKFSQKLAKVRAKRWSFNYIIVPDLQDGDIRNYYLHPEQTFGYNRCAAPFIMVDIMPNGDVTTCRDFIDIKVGNILEKDLLDIWYGRRFSKFRKLLIEHNGLLPQCTRCCGLMGF